MNVSSLLAVETHPYWGLYSAGKFARDAIHQVIAKEEVLHFYFLYYNQGKMF